MVRAVLVLAVVACCPGSPRHEFGIGGVPYSFVAGRGSLWLLTCDTGCTEQGRHSAGRIVRIDPRGGRVVALRHLARPETTVVADSGVYVLDFWRDRVRRINPGTLRVVRSLKLSLPFAFSARDNAFLPSGLTVGRRAVWVTTDRGALSRADLQLRRVRSTMRVPPGAFGGGMTVYAGSVWLAESLLGVYRIDAQRSRVVARIRVSLRGGRLAVDRVFQCGGRLLALGAETRRGASTNRYYLARIDVRRNLAMLSRRVPEPRAFTCGAGSLWVAARWSTAVLRIDPGTGDVLGRRRARVGSFLAYACRRLWTALDDGTVRQVR